MPYATFTYDTVKHDGSDRRAGFRVQLLRTGVSVVEFLKKPMDMKWQVRFPTAGDKEWYTVDKSICVYVADDI